MVEQGKTEVVHEMHPSSRKYGVSDVCRCGAFWDRYNQVCYTVNEAKNAEFRDVNFSVTFGENNGYLAVENNFSSAEFSFVQLYEVQNSVTLSIEDLRKLISSLQVMVDGAEKFGKKA
jgi:hypothetical protein